MNRHNKRHPFISKHVSPYRLTMVSLMTVGFILLSVGLLFILIAGPLKQTQELRKGATVSNGTAELSFSPAPSTQVTVGTDQSVDVKVNTKGLQTYVTQLVFDVITNDTTESLDVSFNENSGQTKAFLDVQKVSHGYHVRFIGLPKNVSRDSYFSSTTPTTILTLKYKAKKTGTLQLNFDLERSKVLVGTSDENQYADQLHTLEVVSYPVKEATQPTTSPTATPGPTATPNPGDTRDDLFFYSFNDDNNKLEIFEEGTTNLVAFADLKSGTNYKVVYKTRVQNAWKRNDAPDKTVVTQLKINNLTTLNGSVGYRDVSTHDNGAVVTISGTFVAQASNKFVVKIDPDNAFDEKQEDNNQWTKEVTNSTSTGTTTTSAKQCNETCDSNSQCGTNQRCYNTGTEKRCRLVDNVTSSNCQLPPDQGIHRSCNQYCADTRECASGYTCWYNKCRLPNNLENTSCKAPTGTTKGGLPASQPVVNGCNQTCSSNRDCQSGLRCYQGSCRYPLNLTSSSCSIDTAANGGTTTTATPKPTATPKVTATPVVTLQPTASPEMTTPTATPMVVPPPTADESSLDTIAIFLSTYFSSISDMPNIFGIPTPLFLMGVGLLLLLLAILIFIFSRRRKSTENKPPKQPPITPFIPGPTHSNPQPPTTVLAQRETPPMRLVGTAQPVTITPPPVQPKMQQSSYQPIIHQAGSVNPVHTTQQPAHAVATHHSPQIMPQQEPVAPVRPAPVSLPQSGTPTQLFAQRVVQQSLPVKPPTPVVSAQATPIVPTLAAPPEEKVLAEVKPVPEIPAHLARPVQGAPPSMPAAPTVPSTGQTTATEPKLSTEVSSQAVPTNQFSSMMERLKQKGISVNSDKNK